MTDAAVSDRENRSVSVTARLEPDLARRVAEAAEREGRPVSNWLRQAVVEKLKDAETC